MEGATTPVAFRNPGLPDSLYRAGRRVVLLDSTQVGSPLGIEYRHPSTPMEIRWDGHLLGRTGHIGYHDEEHLGMRRFFPIPLELSQPGEHVLEVTASQREPMAHAHPGHLQIGVLEDMRKGLYRESLILLFLAGAFLFTALFHIIHIYSDEECKISNRIFSAIFLACSVHIGVSQMDTFFRLEDTGILLQRLALASTWFLMMTLPPLYSIRDLWAKGGGLAAGILTVATLVVLPWTLYLVGILPAAWGGALVVANEWLSYVSLAITTGFVMRSHRSGLPGARETLIGLFFLAVGVVASWQLSWDLGWALGLAALVVFITIGHTKRLTMRMQQHQQELLRAARLEIEVLKKNIQPHFLLNSLNSIIAWLEEEPSTAQRLVRALAEELQMLLSISAQQSIPLSEEIRLCRAHLEVMGLRQDKSYALEVEGVQGDELIPPMVLHTLVENGITHGYAGRDHGKFHIKVERNGFGTRLTLFNDGKPRNGTAPAKEGTGLRYVRSRLEEAFPGRWSLHAGPEKEGYLVSLELKEAST